MSRNMSSIAVQLWGKRREPADRVAASCEAAAKKLPSDRALTQANSSKSLIVLAFHITDLSVSGAGAHYNQRGGNTSFVQDANVIQAAALWFRLKPREQNYFCRPDQGPTS